MTDTYIQNLRTFGRLWKRWYDLSEQINPVGLHGDTLWNDCINQLMPLLRPDRPLAPVETAEMHSYLDDALALLVQVEWMWLRWLPLDVPIPPEELANGAEAKAPNVDRDIYLTERRRDRIQRIFLAERMDSYADFARAFFLAPPDAAQLQGDRMELVAEEEDETGAQNRPSILLPKFNRVYAQVVDDAKDFLEHLRLRLVDATKVLAADVRASFYPNPHAIGFDKLPGEEMRQLQEFLAQMQQKDPDGYETASSDVPAYGTTSERATADDEDEMNRESFSSEASSLDTIVALLH